MKKVNEVIKYLSLKGLSYLVPREYRIEVATENNPPRMIRTGRRKRRRTS